MSEENASLVADEAKSFITEHIPTPAPGDSNGNVPWIGILSVAVVEQATSFTPSGPFLRVKFEVEGTVIGGSGFEEDSLNFDELVNEAIRANDNEFLRLVEPLVVGLEEEPEPSEPSKDASGESLMIILVIVVSIALVLVLVLFIFCARKIWRKDKASKDTLTDQNKNVPPTVLEEVSRNSDHSDSVADQSMYTTVASRKSMNASAILHADNGQSVCSKFSVWSFSAGSDGGADGDDELDVPSTDEDPQLIGSNIETVHDLNANDGVFVQIHLDEDKLDSEDGMSQDSDTNATVGEVALMDKTSNDSDSSGKREMDTSPRLGVDDMDEFDNYIDGLPASHSQPQSRGIRKDSYKRKPWHF